MGHYFFEYSAFKASGDIFTSWLPTYSRSTFTEAESNRFYTLYPGLKACFEQFVINDLMQNCPRTNGILWEVKHTFKEMTVI